MSLVQNNNKKNRVIPRGSEIKPKTEFSMNELDKAANSNDDVKIEYVPTATSIKVDTKVRDIINALSLIGYGENQKNVIEQALEYVIDSMSAEQKRSFENQYQVLENKTINSIKKQLV